jgi:hypothetical protein
MRGLFASHGHAIQLTLRPVATTWAAPGMTIICRGDGNSIHRFRNPDIVPVLACRSQPICRVQIHLIWIAPGIDQYQADLHPERRLRARSLGRRPSLGVTAPTALSPDDLGPSAGE